MVTPGRWAWRDAWAERMLRSSMPMSRASMMRSPAMRVSMVCFPAEVEVELGSSVVGGSRDVVRVDS